MDTRTIADLVAALVASLGSLSMIKFLFFMRPERRKAEAEARLKELDVYKKKLDVSLTLIDTLRQRIEQQDGKIRELNERVDKLYVEKHELERLNNELTRENGELRLQLMEAQHNLCVRPDDECLRRMPPRDYCRLRQLARGEYDKYYPEETEDLDTDLDGYVSKSGKEADDEAD